MGTNSKKIWFLLATIIILTSGCTTTNSKKSINNSVNLKTVTFKEPPSNLKNNISDSMQYRIEWLFSDGSKATPKEKDTVYYKVLGNQAIFVLKVPLLENPLYQVIFLEDKQSRWAITSGVECIFELNDPLSRKYKIDLPMKQFSSSSFEIVSDKKNVWTFVDDNNKIITISKFKQNKDEITHNKSFKNVKTGNRNIYVNIEDNTSSLYYLEKGFIIWICGNITEKEIMKLANSLPDPIPFLYKKPVLNP